MSSDESQRISIGDRVTIYRRGDKGIFTADFWHEDKHVRRSLKTRNLKVARQRAIKLEAELQEGVLQHAPSPISISDAIDAFIEHKKTEDLESKSLIRYRGMLKLFCEHAEKKGILKVTQVTPPLIDQFRACRKKVLKPKTMLNEGVVLKSFFRWCCQRGYVSVSPMETITFRRPKPKPRGGPTLEQENKILARAKESRQIQIAILVYTGMRSGELRNLQPCDVDLEGNWIYIVSRESAKTKTRESRKVPIHGCLRPYLEALPRHKKPWLFTAPPSKKYPDGNHFISTKRLNNHVKRLLESLSIPAGRDGGYTTHSFRHSFETTTVNAGIPQRVVDTWMGHKSDRSMASVYYRLSDEDSQKFMAKIPFTGDTPTTDANEG